MTLDFLGTGDRDNDGVPDWQEVLAGTDPDDPTSRLIVDPPVQESPGQISVNVPTVPGRYYLFQFNDGLSASGWTSLGPPVLATGNQLKFYDSFGALVLNSRFYRVIVVDQLAPPPP